MLGAAAIARRAAALWGEDFGPRRIERVGNATLMLGDCRDVLSFVSAAHACVTDPPYELGFMGKKWDASGIANDPSMWRALLNALRPGAHVLAFSGSRTYHRMACAIEDAGFDIRDQIMWLYGSGMPKGNNLKPAHEPICVARRRFIGSATATAERFGTVTLNIDACRVEHASAADRAAATPQGRVTSSVRAGAAPDVDREGRQEFDRPDTSKGRFPANVMHDGSDDVLAAFPDAPGQLADASSSDSRKTQNAYGVMKRGSKAGPARGDAGSAARFFYCAKASKKDRGEGNTHPTVKPTELMRYLCRLVTPPGGMIVDPFMGSGSTGVAAIAEGFAFTGIEQDEKYFEIALRRIRAAVDAA